MRLRRLIAVMTAATAMLILIPAAASTAGASARHPIFRGFGHHHCRISIEVAPREIMAGEPVTITGRLACRNSGREANRTVQLYHHLPRSFGFSYVQSTTTDAHGFYSFTRADGVVDTDRSWYVRSYRARSAVRRIRVLAHVALNGPTEGSQLLTGRPNQVTFTGTVDPADVGARVVLQRQNAATGSQWHRIDRGFVEPGGSFSIPHSFLVPGEANIRVLVRRNGRDIASTSNVLHYTVVQAQNPALTIAASADPILIGQSVTIAGVLAGGVSQPVTLYARAAHTRRFRMVTQAGTDASGNYSFPPQTPGRSTVYEVTGGGQTSATLYEGVRPINLPPVTAESPETNERSEESD